MRTSIYELLMYSNPQALADLDSYQRKNYRQGVTAPQDEPLPIHFDYEGVGEDYDKEMRKPPSHQVRVE